jgi:uncharacterized protein YidB (DUF937 family)
MTTAVLGMLTSQGPGSLQNMLQSFQSNGLGDVVQSWVGNGANQAISPDQVHAALGTDTILQLGQKAGLSPEITKIALATVLPCIVDKLTPGGQMPQGNSLLAEGMGLLKQFM